MSSYQNRQQQGETQGTALIKRLTKNHLALTEDTQQVLVSQGIAPEMLPVMAAGCLSIGVPPNLLRYTHNVPTVVNAVKLITDFGYRPKEDFYISIFKSNVEVLDENGEPTDQKAKAPTVVVMTSAARLEENAKEDDRLRGLLHIVETGIVEDPKQAEAIFNEHFNGKRPFKDAVVAYAELYTYHAKSGNPLGSGKPQVFYGFYAPWTIYNGKVQLDYNESNKPKDNYEAPQVARKRAASKAWRAVTRNNYPRDDRTVDMRRIGLIDSASTRLTELEQKAQHHGVSVETLIEYGEPEPEDRPELLHDAEEPEYFGWREADEPVVKTTDDEFKWPTDEEAITFCAQFAEGATGSVASTLEALRGLHANSEQAMMTRSYSVLSTALNTAFGTNAAPCVLSAICGRYVDADNPPGQDLDVLVVVLEGETSTTRYQQIAELVAALKAAIVG